MSAVERAGEREVGGGETSMHNASRQERAQRDRGWEKPMPGSPPQFLCSSTSSASAPQGGLLRSAPLYSASDHRQEPQDPCKLATTEERKTPHSIDLLRQTSVQS